MANEFPEATARPWVVKESKVPLYERVISVVADCDPPDPYYVLSVCKLDGGGSLNPKVLGNVRSNAALIVTAVNSYDALREAAEAAFKYIQVDPVLDDEGIAIVAQLRAALHPQPEQEGK